MIHCSFHAERLSFDIQHASSWCLSDRAAAPTWRWLSVLCGNTACLNALLPLCIFHWYWDMLGAKMCNVTASLQYLADFSRSECSTLNRGSLCLPYMRQRTGRSRRRWPANPTEQDNENADPCEHFCTCHYKDLTGWRLVMGYHQYILYKCTYYIALYIYIHM